MTSDSLYRSGQLPKFAADSFKTTDDRWLIPTAEVPLVNLVAGERLSYTDLPNALWPIHRVFARKLGLRARYARHHSSSSIF